MCELYHKKMELLFDTSKEMKDGEYLEKTSNIMCLFKINNENNCECVTKYIRNPPRK
jgi:hypothetical protein